MRNAKVKYSTDWYAKNRERAIRTSVEYKQRFPIETAIRAAKSNAKTRSLTYSLDDELVADLVTDNCFYCGAAPAPMNGVDRVDNTVGYVETNVVSCCRFCNIAKNNHTADAFVGWIYRAHAHQERFNHA